jgi:hypothetical protein
MRGTVRNVKARTKAVSSATMVSPRRKLFAKAVNLPLPLNPVVPLGVESSDGTLGSSAAAHLVLLHLYARSRLVMIQTTRRPDAGADLIANDFL